MEEEEEAADPAIVQSVLQACSVGDCNAIKKVVAQHGRLYGCYQDESTGQSPLMVAAHHGHLTLVQYLLETCHAPWNAVDKCGQCAGNFATAQQQWDIVQHLVDWGTRAELILGTIQRQQMRLQQQEPDESTAMTVDDDNDDDDTTTIPVQHQPSTKPDYLRQQLHYKKDVLLDSDHDAVMMEWERPLMKAHAEILMQGWENSSDHQQQLQQQQQPAPTTQRTNNKNKRVLNVGFGMGIIDGILQEQYHPAHHIIIEAHPDVHRRMEETGWLTKPNVRVCFGKWQDVIPQLIQEGTMMDAIFFDTYGEHYLDMEDFHSIMTHILAKPHGVYSFFNGLAPDNLFFHGVACNCVKLHLSSLGLDSEFAACEIQVNDHGADGDNNVWKDVRRKYWHGRDTYYLPIVKWNPQFLSTGQVPESPLLKRKGEDSMDSSIIDPDDNNSKNNNKRPAC